MRGAALRKLVFPFPQYDAVMRAAHRAVFGRDVWDEEIDQVERALLGPLAAHPLEEAWRREVLRLYGYADDVYGFPDEGVGFLRGG